MVQADGVLDILKAQDTSFALEKELKKDIGSLFPPLNKPHDFIKAFEERNFERALSLWFKSIKDTAFAKSSTGLALYSYILFNNGFEFLALNTLLEKSRPEDMDAIVSKLWKTDISKQHSVWDYFFFPLSQKWQSLFDEEIIFKLGSKIPFQLNKDQEYIKSLLALPLNDTVDTFSIEWSFVLSLIQTEDMDSATKILAWLINKTKDQNKRDMIHLTVGRLLADVGEVQASLSYYSQVKIPSYFWLLAQEEKAWISFNKEDYGKAYSTVSAFEYPQFKKELSPFMFLIRALSQLKNCDYKGLARSLTDFKFLFSKKEARIEKILTSNSYKALIQALLAFYRSGSPYYGIGGYSDLFYHLKKDNFLRSHILLSHYINNKKSRRKTRFPFLDEEENQIAYSLEDKIKNRIQSLLKKEQEKIAFVLTNFQINEVEALYRIYGYHSLLPVPLAHFGNSVEGPFKLFYRSELAVFPFEADEIWLDERADYRSLPLKGCPQGSFVL